MDPDELEALMAIYGEELVSCEDCTVRLMVSSTADTRLLELSATCASDYPDSAPSMAVDGHRGVQNEALIRIRDALVDEAQLQLGMPMMFALAERAKQLLDALDGPDDDEEEKKEENNGNVADNPLDRPRNHQVSNSMTCLMHSSNSNCVVSLQVGQPLIVDGRRCTENVFLEWREKWLERRAMASAERLVKEKAAWDGRPTGKQMFLATESEGGEDHLAMRAIQATVATGAVDASLFIDDQDDSMEE